MTTPDKSDFFAQFAHLMSEEEISLLSSMGMGKRLGFGKNPALLVIDVQNYIVGKTSPDDDTHYPSCCPEARKAIPVIAMLAEAFRAKGRPVIYTASAGRRDGRDLGIKRLKRCVLDIEGWYLNGTKGAQIVKEIAPQPQDIVIHKMKNSGFHATPMLDILIDAKVDTVVLVGGSTSNCIRATALDAFAHNFRTIVVRDAVSDRVRISHEVNLMDIARQSGDVVMSDEVHAYLEGIPYFDFAEAPAP